MKSLMAIEHLVKTLNNTMMVAHPTNRPLTNKTDHVRDESSLLSSDDHQLSEGVSLRNMLFVGKSALNGSTY